MEILAKFSSSMSGFWWSLDEHERRQLLLVGIYIVGVLFAAPLERGRKRREQEELAEQVAARIMAAGRG